MEGAGKPGTDPNIHIRKRGCDAIKVYVAASLMFYNGFIG